MTAPTPEQERLASNAQTLLAIRETTDPTLAERWFAAFGAAEFERGANAVPPCPHDVALHGAPCDYAKGREAGLEEAYQAALTVSYGSLAATAIRALRGAPPGEVER
jgi:hypothetical protein